MGRSGPPLQPGPRTSWGRLRRPCVTCGKAQGRGKECGTCYDRARMQCACGQPRGRNARQCRACYRASQQAHRSAFTCECCGAAFWRRGKASYMGHRDAFRFCSKRCWGATKAALAAPLRQARRETTHIERELTQTIRAELQRVLGPPPGQGKRQDTNRQPQVPHVCPDCGVAFLAVARRVYCSRPCAKRYGKMRSRGRYPPLIATPVIERNQIASMLSSVRAVQRMLWGS